MVEPLSPAKLCWTCDPSALAFETTDDLPDLSEMAGQDRVAAAMRFALTMTHRGYNVYALGPEGLGKHEIVTAYLKQQAAEREAPSDWCYVTNFEEPRRPRWLALPRGRGRALRDDMERFVEECGAALRAAFESEEYRTGHDVIDDELKERQKRVFEAIEREAGAQGITLLRTPTGFALTPVEDGRVLSPEEFQKKPREERQRIEREIARLQDKLKEALRQMPQLLKTGRDRLRTLNEQTASFAVRHLVDTLCESYAAYPEVVRHLEQVGRDVIAHFAHFLAAPQGGEPASPDPMARAGDEPAVAQRYRVNLVVDNTDIAHAPVVFEDNPTFTRLVGSIEHRAEMGMLVTDFTLIRAGALHRANGGYLVLDARKVLSNPLTWEALKHALRAGEIRIEPPAQALGLPSTTTLEPQPIPLDVKLVLVGERRLYYLLSRLDPEFAELFKVPADFEEDIDRESEAGASFARLIATLARRNALKPFARDAVARILRHAARLAGDSRKFSAQYERIADLMREADHHAGASGRGRVCAGDVEAAIEAEIFRTNRIEIRLREQVERGTLLVDTEGAKVGQINGLAVLAVGSRSFGKASRITARVRMGRGRVVDIEREVALGGPLHSKGVLILSGYLHSRFSRDKPISLQGTLVFEQSYGGVDGDSASSAELYALLSAIAEAPIRQDLAVTGSVNQAGEVQAIGGVNEKIEGFFDICAARGLTGTQGVLIPRANVEHLMLANRVVEAAEAGRFHIYPIAHVDEGIALLTGLEAGERDAQGAFPEGSVNAGVERTLAEMAERMRDFSRRGQRNSENRDTENGE